MLAGNDAPTITAGSSGDGHLTGGHEGFHNSGKVGDVTAPTANEVPPTCCESLHEVCVSGLNENLTVNVRVLYDVIF